MTILCFFPCCFTLLRRVTSIAEWLSSVREHRAGQEAAAVPPGSTGQEVRGPGGARGPQPLPCPEAEFHKKAVGEGRLQEQVKYSSLLSSVVNFQVGRTKWIALYPVMQSVTEEQRV